jgi:hypothetical protein
MRTGIQGQMPRRGQEADKENCEHEAVDYVIENRLRLRIGEPSRAVPTIS